MSGPIALNLAVEDSLSEAVLRRMLAVLGSRFEVANCFGHGGFGYLKKSVKGFNNAAKGIPFLLLTDLDKDECAPSLIAEWLPVTRHHNLLFRVAVREVEAWLLAHRSALADYFAVSEAHIPVDPESLPDPKQSLIAAARKSRRREIREAIVPAAGTSAKQGPDYNACLGRFVIENWDPHEAQKQSDSLKRTMRCLAKFAPELAIRNSR